ncbi:xanthine dehydrogenase family protein molybdopterin-binding subunit [Acidisphaera rubrifaciens]|uniref:Carbon monoxide dehydrogenase/molybdopterin binding aldehyde oxidase n=1 Tax=Acidisphaera rubrifaciens HS-AP3 TaxID=1231350 RepID=A0A0D6P219_9PROT|nr:xanthine dehydrogenase family protein molybdopterin-binding subunit [Acidisphaera rubrifaciens]GAN75800.1 carbon monoxide dehydrogenase/molybdopterin binding aldehyde oxidase [Acidisphaera rubrifaciens HS-AP3]
MTKFGLAQPVRRVEDPRLLKGSGRYTDDINLPGMLYGHVLRSPHAAARIVSMDTTAAAATPGVKAVYTVADLKAAGIGPLVCAIPLKNRDGSDRANPPRMALADGAVRHVGDPVAFVVAETPQAARDGAEAVAVDYDLLPANTDLAAASDADTPLVWPDIARNICFDWEIGDKAATDAAFAEAAHVTRLQVINNRIVVNSMEARACIADYSGESGRWTLYANTQGGWVLKQLLGQAVFKVDPNKFRLITPDVGGGFGMKLFLYPEHVLTCFASRALGAPVKWASDRGEAFLSDTQGRDNITLGELAVDKDGRFLALRSRNVANMGAYLSTFAPFIPTGAGTGVLASVYGFKAVYANVIGVFTNTVPVDAYRGAGRPEANYLVERLIDAAAVELGIDRAEIRRRNMVPPSAMPHKTPVGKLYDSGDFVTVLDAALAKMDWAGFPARRAEAAKRGKRRGIGLSYYLEATGGAPSERAEIRFADDGFVDVFVGTQSTGQGHETAYTQLVSVELGVDGEKIRIFQGDTDTIPTGGGTGGARSLYSEGQAILATTAVVLERGKKAASEALEAAPADIVFEDGVFTIVGTDRAIDIIGLAVAQRARAAKGEDVTTLDAAEVAEIKAHTFPNGCHIAEVEVDPDTGTVDVVRYAVTDDVGRAINPLVVRGQVHGGVAQGFGQAVLERTAYDSGSGQLLTGSLMDYCLPRAYDLPDIEVDFIEVPCASNPLGVKGAGEAGAVGSPPAVMNAIVDALRPVGVTHLDMPATPESVWQAISRAKAA